MDYSFVGYERHKNSNTLQTIDDLGDIGEGRASTICKIQVNPVTVNSRTKMANSFLFFVFSGTSGVFLIEIKVRIKKIVFGEHNNATGTMKDAKRERRLSIKHLISPYPRVPSFSFAKVPIIFALTIVAGPTITIDKYFKKMADFCRMVTRLF